MILEIRILKSADLSLLCVIVMIAMMAPRYAIAQRPGDVADCGSLKNAYGPFDYTNSNDRTTKLPRVEKAHFDAGVRELRGHGRRAFNWANLAADLDYTLRAFPNHHLALYSMAQFHLREFDKNRRMRYSAYCYFDRAKRNAPHDGNVYLIEGIYLARLGRTQEAEKSYLKAISIMPGSSEAHYDLGLLYIETKNYPAARELAKVAYELGYPMLGLRNKLEKLGQWED